MKKGKLLSAIVILVLFLAAFLCAVHYSKIYSHTEKSTPDDLRAANVLEAFHMLDNYLNSLETGFAKKTTVSVNLMSMALSYFVSDEGYTGPDSFEDGIVIRDDYGKIVYPKNSSVSFPEYNDIHALVELPPATKVRILENGEERDVLITNKPISEDLYYIDWAEMDDYHLANLSDSYIHDSIETLEYAIDGYIFIFEERDEEMEYFYIPEEFESSGELERIGISWKTFEEGKSNLSIDGDDYNAWYETVEFQGHEVNILILASPINSNINYQHICIAIAFIFIFLDLLGLILYVKWLGDYIQENELNEKQKEDYSQDRLRSRMILKFIANALVLCLILAGYQLIGSIAAGSSANQEILNMMMDRLENSSKQDAVYREDEETWNIFCAGRIAELYSDYPELQTKEFLEKANSIIGSRFIMVFDEFGEELLSSNSYLGFSLGKEIPSTEEFRFLLQGVDHIILEPETDQFTGETVQMIGARTNTVKNGLYGAVILSVDPLGTWKSVIDSDITSFADRLALQNYLTIITDNSNNTVLYASDIDLIGRAAEDIGLNPSDSVSTSLGSYEILGEKYYGAYSGSSLYNYFLLESSIISDNLIAFPAFAAVSYLIISFVMVFILLGVSDSKFFVDKNDLKKAAGTFDFYRRESLWLDESGLNSFKEKWPSLSPEHKLSKYTDLTIAVFLIVVLVLFFTQRTGSVFGFILTGNWKHGVNGLAITAIITVIGVVAIFIFFKNLILDYLCRALSPKTETIVRLLASLIHYSAVIYAFFLSLSYLGINAEVLITTAGILTLAVSLGSKDLIADIIAGVFIIFEDDFHVGDAVEVNGCAGFIEDIGIRTTRIRDYSNNIKIIDNQSVKNILNRSMLETNTSIKLTVPVSQPIEEIEEMLCRELPKIAEAIPQIHKGPLYSGIVEIDNRSVILAIKYQSLENDAYGIKLEINHRLIKLFKENNYELGEAPVPLLMENR